MCARFTSGQTQHDLEAYFGIYNLPEYSPRYNVAPSQSVTVVRLNASGLREFVQLRWGFVPSWSNGSSQQAGFVNAKAETVFDKPSFQEAIRQRRCLVPADGFIEWETIGGLKYPHWFRLADRKLFAFAGIWEPPCAAGKTPEESTFAILTVQANSDVAPFHDRMPAILAPEAFDLWLDPKAGRAELEQLLSPSPSGSIVSHPVSRSINHPSQDCPELLEPVVLGLFG